MRDDGELLVSIEGEPGSGKRGREPSLKELQDRAEQATQDARAAMRDRDAWQARERQAYRESLGAYGHLLTVEQNAAEAELKRALDYADYDAQIAAQRSLASIETRRVQYNQAVAEQAARPAASSDPTEAFTSQLSARSRDFIRSNPDLIRDDRAIARVRAAHFDAESRGIPIESEQYFQHVREYAADSGDEAQSPRARAQQERTQPNKVTVRLSREDRQRFQETAESLGLSFDEYMRRKYLMDRDPAWRRQDELGQTI
jgi:hypothetical protein